MSETQVNQSLSHAILTDDYATQWMGIELLAVGEGTATISMQLRQEMLNGFGIAHGGMVFALADTAFALSCNPAEGSDETITVASGVDINFLKPGIPGRTLTAHGQRVAQQGRSGVYDIKVTQTTPHGEDELLAVFRGRSRTIPKPA
ncbi:hydroxyphenylacetyl-CoA thioesterase PaaI [Glutamicibacter sp. MNS18]|uniref:hydroxyphenylacetyl-CoA thioesterase PaaI n=1 Tax=Glutamicibacter sp. MNS18 TaxID=2989817 RepID=UPI00223545BC|nr:hydroxyphenylacetyl-CoA thioesterase PaaI [Glutamicibacter sp. MNS18]MCW4464057.1 hydroxyphenylacetyl-CoA thioesterase PaaI [Glutamicibacter sp. MNS18]